MNKPVPPKTRLIPEPSKFKKNHPKLHKVLWNMLIFLASIGFVLIMIMFWMSIL